MGPLGNFQLIWGVAQFFPNSGVRSACGNDRSVFVGFRVAIVRGQVATSTLVAPERIENDREEQIPGLSFALIVLREKQSMYWKMCSSSYQQL